MHRCICAFLLGAALLAPVSMRAGDDDHHDRDHARRYWDPEHRDWHEWNDREDRAYRHYLEEQHREHRDWDKINKKQQREYWKWRHEHRDQDDHDRH